MNTSTRVEYSACTAYHATNRIFEYPYRRFDFVHFPECTACKPDPHRNTNTPNCLCDKGYLYDGTNCIGNKILNIFPNIFMKKFTKLILLINY